MRKDTTFRDVCILGFIGLTLLLVQASECPAELYNSQDVDFIMALWLVYAIVCIIDWVIRMVAKRSKN